MDALQMILLKAQMSFSSQDVNNYLLPMQFSER